MKRKTGYFITMALLVGSLLGNSAAVAVAADPEYNETEDWENENPDNAEAEETTDEVMDSDESTEEPEKEEPIEEDPDVKDEAPPKRF